MSVIVNGIGPTSGASALGDLTDIGTMGEPIAQADDLTEVVTAMGGASAVRTAIDAAEDGGAPAVNSDALAGTGWSTASATGGAVATWASSPARLTLDCNPGAAGSCGVTHTTKLPNREEYSIAIRVQVVNGDNSNQARIILACGQSANDCAKMALYTDGSIELGATVGGSYVYWWTVASIAAIGPTARTGGELWLRFDRRAGLVVWSYGIGTGGALPTVWTEVYGSTERHVAGQHAHARDGKKASNGTHVGIYAVTLSGVNLDVAVLAIKTGLPGAFGGA